MSSTSSNIQLNDKIARKNAIILSLCFAFGGVTTFSVMSLAAVAGQSLAVDKSLATLPVTMFLIASMITSVPATMMMRHFGRKIGFQFGVFMGFAGCLFAAFAIVQHSFIMFNIATFLIGVMASFQAFYRFAAADSSTDRFKSVAVSWVMFGGILAPIFAPTIISYSKDMLAPYFLAGSFVAAGLVTILTFFTLNFVQIAHEKVDKNASTGRPLLEIIKQPLFMISVISGMVSYGLMTFVMTATPLAILGCGQGYEIDDVTFVIQWHAIAMYGPSFYTGKIIQRFGAHNVVIAGLVMLAGCAIVSTFGVDISHFWVALLLLGLGWNFGFVGATAMLTQYYRPEERFKAQAFNDFCVFGTLAVGSFASGLIYENFGWEGVNVVVYPFVILAIGLIIVSHFIRKKQMA